MELLYSLTTLCKVNHQLKVIGWVRTQPHSWLATRISLAKSQLVQTQILKQIALFLFPPTPPNRRMGFA